MAIKISNEMHSVNEQPINYNQLYSKLSEKYRNLFMTKYDDTIFIYRALGRGEFREIISDTTHHDLIKEEMLCFQCVVYPEDYDWENCPAGLPTSLADEILKRSFLDSPQSRKILKNYYRAEMYDIDNQITCIIQEAFPNYDIEEIETWSMERTMKYLSRAEWKLKNFRGLEPVDAGDDFYDETNVPQENVVTDEKQSEKVEKKTKSDKTIRGGSKKNKLTVENAQAKADFLKKFPMFSGHDDGEEGIDGLKQTGVDTTPPALRVGW